MTPVAAQSIRNSCVCPGVAASTVVSLSMPSVVRAWISVSVLPVLKIAHGMPVVKPAPKPACCAPCAPNVAVNSRELPGPADAWLSASAASTDMALPLTVAAPLPPTTHGVLVQPAGSVVPSNPVSKAPIETAPPDRTVFRWVPPEKLSVTVAACAVPAAPANTMAANAVESLQVLVPCITVPLRGITCRRPTSAPAAVPSCGSPSGRPQRHARPP